MVDPKQRPSTGRDVAKHISDFTLHLVLYASVSLVVIIALWWVGWLALLVSGAEPQGRTLTTLGRLGAAFGAIGLVAVLAADVTLGWGVCALARRGPQEKDGPT